MSSVDATRFFRQQVGQHYHGKTATTDGRGCARQTSTRFVCTAYVRNPSEPNRNIDVYGVVTIKGGNMNLSADLAHGQQIQNWFMATGGGCQVASCRGAVFHGS